MFSYSGVSRLAIAHITQDDTVPYNRSMNKMTLKRVRAALPAALAALLVLACVVLVGCGGSQPQTGSQPSVAASSSTSKAANIELAAAEASVSETGSYTGKYEVAAYIHLYGHLPDNFVSKTKARKAGWIASKGNLQDVLPGKSIGGSEFYNDEGQLPNKNGRTYTECDIDYSGGTRGAKRIVFSNDGLVFYTADHYKTFERLY